jgi:hypothetical protein
MRPAAVALSFPPTAKQLSRALLALPPSPSEKDGLVWASLGTPLVEPEALQLGYPGQVRTGLRSLPINASQEEVSEALLAQANRFSEVLMASRAPK